MLHNASRLCFYFVLLRVQDTLIEDNSFFRWVTFVLLVVVKCRCFIFGLFLGFGPNTSKSRFSIFEINTTRVARHVDNVKFSRLSFASWIHRYRHTDIHTDISTYVEYDCIRTGARGKAIIAGAGSAGHGASSGPAGADSGTHSES